MKILHLCLSCFYIDNSLYQENELVREHVAMGHEVRVLASTEVMSKGGQLTYTKSGEYMGSDGAMVKRLPYSKLLPEAIMRKLRMHPGVYDEIAAFAPDVIVFHGGCGWEIRTVKRYANRHPNVEFWVDSHEDANNSARGLISRELLHKRYYGPLLRSSLPERHPVLCISLETMDFLHKTYRIPRERLEFFPLGGRPLSDADYTRKRAAKRAELGVQDGEVMLFQSGKFDRLKRLSDTLEAFIATPDPAFKLFLSGVIMKNVDEANINRLIALDSRITFLGWNSPDDMIDLLAAADVYLQPGSQSVTMQNSMCQRCAIVIDDVKSHQPYVSGNGYLTKAGTDLGFILSEISNRRGDLIEMGAASHRIAMEMLDYRKQARRLVGQKDLAQSPERVHARQRSTYAGLNLTQGATDLFAASASGDLDALRDALATVQIDQRDQGGRTALMIACRAGQAPAVRLLIEAGADVNAANSNGTTPLMYAKTAAVGNGSTDMLQLLLAAGADINARDSAGRTALDYVMVNSETVINFLISHGAVR